MRKLICCLILLPLIVPAQAPPAIQSNATEVMFDLVARDKRSRIVRDLKPDEIQVLEDGVPQTIRHFEFVEGSAAAAAPAETATPEEAKRSTSIPPPPTVNDLRDVSVVSIVVGALTELSRKEALAALLGFLKDELRPNVYVGVFGFQIDGEIGMIQRYTNNADLLSAAVRRAVVASGANLQPDMDFGGLPAAAISAPVAATSTTAASVAIADALESVTTNLTAEYGEEYGGSADQLLGILHLIQAQQRLPGRKVVLLFMPGVLVNPQARDLLYGSISAANRTNVTIYGWDNIGFQTSDLSRNNVLLAKASRAIMLQAMDPSHTANPNNTSAIETAERAVQANDRGQLETLAEGTGGALLSNGKDLKGQLDRAMEDARSHYELTYAPTNPAIDGRFHGIEVKVTRPGVKAFARSGYYALPLINGREVYPFEMATLGALNTKPFPHQFEFHAAALRFRPGPEKTRYAFVFQAPVRELKVTREKEWATVHVSVTALVRDSEGHVMDKISRDIPYQMPADRPAELERAAVSFTAPLALPPGRYTVETAAVDRQSAKASVRRSVLMVAPAPSGLAASDVTLVRRVSAIHGPHNPSDPLQARGGQVLPELSSSVALAPEDKMSFYAVAYPPAPVQGPVKMSVVLTRDGQTVLDSEGTTVQPEPNGAASVLASLPAAKVPPGDYEARITFSYGGQSATSETEVTVEPGDVSSAAK